MGDAERLDLGDVRAGGGEAEDGVAGLHVDLELGPEQQRQGHVDGGEVGQAQAHAESPSRLAVATMPA